jgi:type IV pilus assembly protein PilN
MYGLDVNFLKDRAEQVTETQTRSTPSYGGTDSMTPLYAGIGVGLLLPLLALGGWWFLNNENQKLLAQQAELTTKLDGLQAKLKEVEAIYTQTKQIDGVTTNLVGVFDHIKPWSAILQDVSNRAPGGVRLASVVQTEDVPPPTPGAQPAPAAAGASPTGKVSTLLLSGSADNYDAVNDFLLTLKSSPFIDPKTVTIQKASLVTDPTLVKIETIAPSQSAGGPQKLAPIVEVKPPDVVAYEIKAFLNNTPAPEQLSQLESLGANGLVTRIQQLKDKGVIQ